jgi:hypothetical protein
MLTFEENVAVKKFDTAHMETKTKRMDIFLVKCILFLGDLNFRISYLLYIICKFNPKHVPVQLIQNINDICYQCTNMNLDLIYQSSTANSKDFIDKKEQEEPMTNMVFKVKMPKQRGNVVQPPV